MKYENWLKKPTKQLKKIAKKYESEYIRRKSGNVCFTCGAYKDWKNMDCGHYVHTGKAGHWMLDHDERNLHAQCTQCNKFMSGNLRVYGLKLEAIYGYGVLQELENIKGKMVFPTDKEIVDKIFELKEKLRDFR